MMTVTMTTRITKTTRMTRLGFAETNKSHPQITYLLSVKSDRNVPKTKTFILWPPPTLMSDWSENKFQVLINNTSFEDNFPWYEDDTSIEDSSPTPPKSPIPVLSGINKITGNNMTKIKQVWRVRNGKIPGLKKVTFSGFIEDLDDTYKAGGMHHGPIDKLRNSGWEQSGYSRKDFREDGGVMIKELFRLEFSKSKQKQNINTAEACFEVEVWPLKELENMLEMLEEGVQQQRGEDELLKSLNHFVAKLKLNNESIAKNNPRTKYWEFAEVKLNNNTIESAAATLSESKMEQTDKNKNAPLSESKKEQTDKNKNVPKEVKAAIQEKNGPAAMEVDSKINDLQEKVDNLTQELVELKIEKDKVAEELNRCTEEKDAITESLTKKAEECTEKDTSIVSLTEQVEERGSEIVALNRRIERLQEDNARMASDIDDPLEDVKKDVKNIKSNLDKVLAQVQVPSSKKKKGEERKLIGIVTEVESFVTKQLKKPSIDDVKEKVKDSTKKIDKAIVAIEELKTESSEKQDKIVEMIQKLVLSGGKNANAYESIFPIHSTLPASDKVVVIGDKVLHHLMHDNPWLRYDLLPEARVVTGLACLRKFLVRHGSILGQWTQDIPEDTQVILLSFGADDVMQNNEVELQNTTNPLSESDLVKANHKLVAEQAEKIVEVVELLGNTFTQANIIYVMPPPSESEPIVMKLLREAIGAAWLKSSGTTEDGSRLSYLNSAEVLSSLDRVEQEGKGTGFLTWPAAVLLSKEIYTRCFPNSASRFAQCCSTIHMEGACNKDHDYRAETEFGQVGCRICNEKDHRAARCPALTIFKDKKFHCGHCGMASSSLNHHPDLCYSRWNRCTLCDMIGHCSEVHLNPAHLKIASQRLGANGIPFKNVVKDIPVADSQEAETTGKNIAGGGQSVSGGAGKNISGGGLSVSGGAGKNISGGGQSASGSGQPGPPPKRQRFGGYGDKR